MQWQWNNPDPFAQERAWREQRGRMLMAARGPSVTLSEDELAVLPELPAECARGVRSLTLWNPTDLVLAHIWKFSRLEELTLIGGRIGDPSVRALAGLTNLGALALLCEVKFTAGGLRDLRAALQHCRIAGADRCGDSPRPSPPVPPTPASKPWWKFW